MAKTIELTDAEVAVVRLGLESYLHSLLWVCRPETIDYLTNQVRLILRVQKVICSKPSDITAEDVLLKLSKLDFIYNGKEFHHGQDD